MRPGAAIAVAAGSALLLAGWIVLGYQGVLWLQNGFWTPLELRALPEWWGGHPWPDPNLTWAGVQKIVIWVLEMPQSLGLILTGIAVFLFGAND